MAHGQRAGREENVLTFNIPLLEAEYLHAGAAGAADAGTGGVAAEADSIVCH